MSSLLTGLGRSSINNLHNGAVGSALKPILLSQNNFSTILLSHFNGDVLDYSRSRLNLILNGGAKIANLSRFGGGSLITSASSDFISIANNSNLGLGIDNFTIEMWAYKSAAIANYNAIFELGTGANPYQNGLMLRLQATGTDPLYIANSPYNWSPTSNFPLNQWNHIALVRNGNIFNLYINGRSVISPITNTANLGSSSLMYIGNSVHSGGTQAFNGYIDELRITKGIARYVSNFDPPTSQFLV